ncbi:DUF2254 domain-containing protein [Brevirhabdus sp.]|uniref:DUF2254 domain-containing protein n=1 Tax=Brevirhabdus sp. TaxID=2004514 RepID=UPI004057CE1C
MIDTLSTRLFKLATALKLDKPVAIFFTLPAVIATGILGLGFGLVFVDAWLETIDLNQFFWVPPYDAASTFLAAVAGGAITALSLAYSLTLVVFTLAAGTIGPRLLQRFTSEATIQITAGVFGGTFLFALNGIFFTRPDFVPAVTLAVTALLAAVCVAQLIYFVRHVASNVTIDEEIGKIGQALTEEVDQLMDGTSESMARKFDGAAMQTLKSVTSGYLGRIDTDSLADFACERDLRLRFRVSIGQFVLRDAPLIDVLGEAPLDEDGVQTLRRAFSVNLARSQAQTVDFSLRLLVEIALRALSPGINDTFTAITCLDRMTSGLRRPVAENLDARFYHDAQGTPRVYLPGLSVADLIETVFGPIRNTLGSNFLMATSVARSLRRLDELAHEKVRSLLKQEADLLMRQVNQGSFLRTEIEEVRSLLGGLYPADEPAPEAEQLDTALARRIKS